MGKRIENLKETANREKFITDFCSLPSVIRQSSGKIPPAYWQSFLMQKEIVAEFFIAYEGQDPVARLGVNVSRTAGLGHIGFYEAKQSAQESSTQLINSGLNWLKRHSVNKVIGPMNFNSWYPYRFKLYGANDQGDFLWEPHNPHYYPLFFTHAGFHLHQEYHSIGTKNIEGQLTRCKIDYEKVLAKGSDYTMRDFDKEQLLERELPALYEMSMKGFVDNYLFAPISYHDFLSLYVPMLKTFDLSLSKIAVHKSGAPAGFFLIFINGTRLILKSTAILPEHRGQGIFNMMIYPSLLEAEKSGITETVSALMIKGAQSESFSKHGDTVWEHRYALYEKLI